MTKFDGGNTNWSGLLSRHVYDVHLVFGWRGHLVFDCF